MSYATLLTALDSKVEAVSFEGAEILQGQATITGKEGLPVFLQVKPDASSAANMLALVPGDLVIASGDLRLDQDGNCVILHVRSASKGYADQFVNEASITGRLSGQTKEAESGKSISSSIAVNRFSGANSDEHTDWFRVRCFGFNKDKLHEAPKGALVTASGILERRTGQDGKIFPELKARVLRVHARAGNYNHAEGTSAAGYAQSDFQGDDTPVLPSDWN